MKKHLLLVATAILALTLGACRSKDQRIIDRIDRLTERIQNDSENLDKADWDKILQDISDIHDQINDNDFTPEEMQAIARAEGQLMGAMAREGVKAVKTGMSDALETINDFANGFLEGLEDD